jgi:hypothetical protein
LINIVKVVYSTGIAINIVAMLGAVRRLLGYQVTIAELLVADVCMT